MQKLFNILTIKMIVSAVCLVLLSACSITPLKIPFPTPPQELMEPAPDLQTLPENKVELSTAETVIAKNYGLYHELKAKYEAWQSWAKQQKEINP